MTVNVSTHSRPKAAGQAVFSDGLSLGVSTHSRPKAAGGRKSICAIASMFQLTAARRRLALSITMPITEKVFQLTAARRRLVSATGNARDWTTVSTHSRPKAAGPVARDLLQFLDVSTHSRPKAAG